MPAEDKKYQVPDPDLTQLLSDFKARIKHDWIDILDIRQHGDAFRGIENLPSKNAFYHDLADVLNARYKARFGPGLAALKEIGTYTIRRIFEEGDRRNYDDKTRDMLAVYLGYANWAAYRMRATGRETPDTSGAEKATPSTFTFSIPRYALVAALGLVLLLAGGYYAYSWWRDQPDGERLTVLSTSSPSAPSKLVVRYDLRGLDYQDAYISCGERQVIPQQRVGIITFEVTLPQYSPVELFVDGKRLAMVTQSIESDGWEGFLSLLVPLEKSSFYQEGLLRLPTTHHPPTPRRNTIQLFSISVTTAYRRMPCSLRRGYSTMPKSAGSGLTM